MVELGVAALLANCSGRRSWRIQDDYCVPLAPTLTDAQTGFTSAIATVINVNTLDILRRLYPPRAADGGRNSKCVWVGAGNGSDQALSAKPSQLPIAKRAIKRCSTLKAVGKYIDDALPSGGRCGRGRPPKLERADWNHKM